MWKKTLMTLLILTLGGLFLASVVFWQRTDIAQDSIVVSPHLNTNKGTDTERSNLDDSTTNSDQSQKDTSEEDARKSAFYISRDDCDNECTNFEKNTSPWRYCATICGIIETREPPNSCDGKESLSRDYCLQNKAITTKDPKICNEITDKGIAKTCTNKIIESIVDGL